MTLRFNPDAPSMFGDCRDCGHSAIYHIPLFGCAKCDCDEFH